MGAAISNPSRCSIGRCCASTQTPSVWWSRCCPSCPTSSSSPITVTRQSTSRSTASSPTTLRSCSGSARVYCPSTRSSTTCRSAWRQHCHSHGPPSSWITCTTMDALPPRRTSSLALPCTRPLGPTTSSTGSGPPSAGSRTAGPRRGPRSWPMGLPGRRSRRTSTWPPSRGTASSCPPPAWTPRLTGRGRCSTWGKSPSSKTCPRTGCWTSCPIWWCPTGGT
mmetsp:Transcript_12882/g.23201  ORF Transcript_12882/g.23201 Transcript_12882/m.23201 type:complete len:222 (+) Transcript_12882:491-1156(+)